MSIHAFIYTQDEAFENRVQEIHQGLRGQSNSQAEFNFLRYSRQLEFYGIEQYFARDDHGIEITLGVGADGIVVFRDMTKLSTFSWLALVYNKHYLDKHLNIYLHVHVHVRNHINKCSLFGNNISRKNSSKITY